jgi:TonB-dependent starch-binding outer membrane protein SusC
MKKLFHYCARFIFLMAMLCLCTSAASQKKISGMITGTEGLPLPGVTIGLQGSKVATSSAADGSFSITAKSGDVLLISSVGRRKTTIKLLDQTFLNITLPFDLKSLEEVMVIGYGTAQKKDVTGAVARLTAGEFNTGIITDPLQQVQGKIAGLVITNPGGDPNGQLTVRIRGATSLEGQPPLLVIDGVAIDDFYKAIATLNPGDVESYDILKDASAAAIYGARGANGVILVTTKNGKTGKTFAEYTGSVGIERIARQFDVLDAGQWRKATTFMNAGGLDKGANTDWQKAVSQTGVTNNHLVAIRGGNDQLNFRGSVGFIRQEGVIINSGKEVITGRLTALQKTDKNKLEIRYGLNVSATKRDFLPDQQTTNQSRTSGTFLFRYASSYLPVWPEKNADGTWYQPASSAQNPVFLSTEVYSKQREDFFQGSVKADYEIIKGLKPGVFGALSRATDVYDRFQPVLPGNTRSAEAVKSSYSNQNYSGDLHINYRKSLGGHTVDFTGVYEYNKFLNDGFGVKASGFLVPQLLNNNLGTATTVNPNNIFSYKNEARLISFLGRAVYNYNDRYILTANFRRDGSSKFGSNNRWGNFPSLAFAWTASSERFLKTVDWLGHLKLRLSYGSTGNQENLPPNKYQRLYGPAGAYLYNTQFYQSYAVIQENNPDLKWEVRKSFNAGIDFSLLHDRLKGTIDVFHDHTRDMLFLYDIPQPPFLTKSVYANAASAVNKGIELTLGSTVINNRNITWEIQANVSTLKNHITKLLGQFKGTNLSLNDPAYGFASGGGFGYTPVTRLSVGYPAGVFWLPQHAGLDAAGHELYNNYDVNGKFTGTSTGFTDHDRVYIDPTPRFTWGFTSRFSLQHFDISFFLRGIQGQKIFANSLLTLESIQYLPGSNVTEKALVNGLTDLPQASTYWLKDGSFARLENMTLGYNFSNLKGISNLRFHATATNLFLLTRYQGIDPEIITESSQRYIDLNYYPRTKGFALGVNIGF